MAAPVVSDLTYVVSLAADSLYHTQASRWADLNPFNVSISGGEFRVKDPGGTFGAWRSTTLSISGNVSGSITFADTTGQVASTVISTSEQTLSQQGHTIQLRATSSATPGASVTVSATIAGVVYEWDLYTAGTITRSDILAELTFETFDEDVTNPPTSSFFSSSTALTDGATMDDNVFYERNEENTNYPGTTWAAGTPPAGATALPHLAVVGGDHVVDGGRALLSYIYPPDYSNSGDPGAVDVEYHLWRVAGTGASNRARWSALWNGRFITNGTASVWRQARFSGLKGYRMRMWYGISLYFAPGYKIDYGNNTFNQLWTWYAGNYGGPQTVFDAMSGQTSPTFPGENFWFRCGYIRDDGGGSYSEIRTGRVQFTAAQLTTGVRHYFVFEMFIDDRPSTAGGTPYLKVWHNEHGDSPALLGSVGYEGVQGSGAFLNGYTASTFRWGAGHLLGVGSVGTPANFASGLKMSQMRQYHTGWHEGVAAGTYGGILTNQDVLSVGWDSIRIGGPDSDFSSVHPTGAAQP